MISHSILDTFRYIKSNLIHIYICLSLSTFHFTFLTTENSIIYFRNLIMNNKQYVINLLCAYDPDTGICS